MITVRKPNENEIREFETWPVWEKEESEFDWEYSDKETCYILQGKAQVFDENGAILVEFGKGDLVVFPPGLRCKWKILENMRKHYNLG
jgi:uncharacterized protein